ncbi:MAG: DHA2 family efflux MFS transporter permease subunit [Acidimicrobiales bacterium]
MRERLKDPDVAYRYRWYTLLVLCLSLMVIGLDNTVLNVAIPTLAKPVSAGGLHAAGSELQWIVDAYTIVFAGLLLTAGSLGDRFGRYRGLALGLVIFGTGSAISAMASSATLLILTRGLMGIGGAFIMPSTLSILTNIFQDNRERAKAIGVWAGVSAVGVGFGPIAGGFLLTHFWWGSVFLVNVPIVIAALVLGYLFIPESKDPSAPRLDPIGALLSIAGLVALLWAIIEGPAKGWVSPSELVAFAIAAIVLGTFAWWELHTAEPMLDMRYFRNPRFSAASGAVTITFLTLFGTIFLLTQYFQSVLGYSTLKAGSMLIPQALLMMVFAPMSTRWVHRFGNKVVVVFGMVVVTGTLLAMTTFQTNSSTLHVIAITSLLGFGMAHVMPAATESIMGSLPREKAGVGSAMNDTTRQVGGAVGVGLLGSILSSRYGSHVTSGLAGIAPSSLVDRAKDSIGSALGVAQNDPAAESIRTQITATARSSFVSGMHTTLFIAASIVVLGALAVLKFLPARTHEVDADGRAPIVSGIGPADVTPLVLATDIAEEIEVGRGAVHSG